MIHRGTHVTKGLLLLLRDQEGSLLVGVLPTVSLPVISGLVDPLTLVKWEMLVRHLLVWALFEPADSSPAQSLQMPTPLV